ncbi:MAG: GAF domain-containing protein, partial [Chloroflexi bacterium]|nr:GAF domain-containing protein [Chloroflexota bacterium]
MKMSLPAARHVDWLLFNLRWLLLVAVAVVAFINPGDKLPTAMLLLAAAAYNLVIMLMLTAGALPGILPGLTLVLDSLLAIAIFQTTGRAAGMLVWAALFPILSAALRFGWQISLGTTAVILASEAILVVVFDHDPWGVLAPFVFQGLFLGIAAAVAGLVGERVNALSAREMEEELEQDARRLRTVREQVRAVYQMASAVSATLDYERVLEAALDLGSLGAAELDDEANLMVSAVLLLEEEQLHVTAGRRLTPADARLVLPGKAGLLAEALRRGEPKYSAEPFRDPELQSMVALRSCNSLMCVPLGADFQTFGILLFGHPRPGYFDMDHIELLAAI